jgi:hypothetical protein
MNRSTENDLRNLFAEAAAAAPEAVGLGQGALQKVRHRRRVQMVCAAAVVGIGVGVGLLTAGSLGDPSDRAPIAAPSVPHSGATTAAPTRQGPVPSGASEDCVETYSPAAVAGRSFAFDGTVTAIGPAQSNRAGQVLPLVGVTFKVNQWFRGGSNDTVTVDWYPPHLGNSNTDPSLASYGVGSRLLISGEPRFGGAALDAPVAWTCGFTRYYDRQTAATWASATH